MVSDNLDVLATANLRGPGEFEMRIPTRAKKIGFLVYEDKEGDGPTARDRRFDLLEQVVPVDGDVVGIIIDLDKGLVAMPQ